MIACFNGRYLDKKEVAVSPDDRDFLFVPSFRGGLGVIYVHGGFSQFIACAMGRFP